MSDQPLILIKINSQKNKKTPYHYLTLLIKLDPVLLTNQQNPTKKLQPNIDY